ncbi:MAG: pirin family protein [Sulfuricellaceae bacterium]|jgi:redox-sensitive bicupin YhaK (pirin superfamily)
MIRLRPHAERGHFDHGWLDTWHSFSFGDYFDPEHNGYSALRVINDDRIAGGGGFPTHPHSNMEIVTYILEGALAHRDSFGHGSTILPGDVQRMSAGRGIRHSEFNASQNEAVHLLQIWLLPQEQNLDPGYEQKSFSPDAKRGRLCLIASPDGRDGSVTIHQDARIYAALLGHGEPVAHRPSAGRRSYLHVAWGTLSLNGVPMTAGDGARIENEPEIRLEGDAEALLFDLP